jgi:hypothetical protein
MMRELSICVAVLGLGCYGPNPNYVVATDTGEQASEGSDSSGNPETGTDTSVETSTDTSTTETETGTDTTDTEDMDPSCANQNPDFGEFCFAFVDLLALPEVQSLAPADFDGDDHVDLAIARKDDVLVLFGDGAGSFPFQTDLAEPNSNYFGAAGGDLDGDQLADLVVAAESSNVVLVHRSQPGGSFAAPLDFATGMQPQRLALADLDGDAVLDLMVVIKGQDTIEVLLGDGDAGFGEPSTFSTGADQPVDLGLGSFDIGTTPDLVVGNLNGESLAILLGSAPGEFAAAQLHPLAGKPRSTTVADFDLDGHLDVATALEDLDRVQVLHGDGLGGLIDDGVELPVGNKPIATLTSDFDLDGIPDLLVVNHDDATVGLMFGLSEPPGQFRAQLLLVGFNGFASMSAVASADLNHDEIGDVVIGGGSGVRAMISDP